jgi:hypothetical protein
VRSIMYLRETSGWMCGVADRDGDGVEDGDCLTEEAKSTVHD